MYVPSHFREDDIGKLHQYIRDYEFGLLVIANDGGTEANHVPFLLSSEQDSTLGQLQCHLARNNPWSVDDAPTDFAERLVQAIVGVEINIETRTGKLKASQNQPENNRSGVKAGLEAG